ncbi:helix-turn-helix domain-containing protein [Microbispora triticiradicis]|uniref:helix-turn-helix domain-containing protein n=1 Tax=Microbispora triticiradicis TaxID=2200763 RepID=UPI001AD79A44|nr:helix-turn-helix transcriptional regulator [Microbispora triticiradicis]MBO4274077.1 helix-turn-helix domain-containing protein [Microbispora triticiradicis]
MAAQDLVGQRIKAIRRQRGLSQAQLAHPELSDSYVSLIESGKRTPTPAVLELLAQKLDCSLTYLVNGVTAEQMEDLEVGLSFARMALENGEVAEARRRYAELLADGNLLGLPALRVEARYGYALASEACGEVAEAISVLEELSGSEAEAMTQERKVAVALALCRCHRERGDYSAAVQVGEHALETMARSGWNDGLVELGATLLSVYLWRGDLLRAGHFATELLAAAEALGTPRSAVASSWNAALVAEQVGRGEEAINLIERALAIQSETGEPRNLARLRQAYANMLLRLHPEESEKARDLLLRAQREMEAAATSTFDRAHGALALAWAEIVLQYPEQAVEYAQTAIDLVRGTSGWLETRAALLLSQARFLLHQDDKAAGELDIVSEWLEDALPTRKTAEDWMTIGEMRRRIGDDRQSVAAYQRALACAGL